MLRRCFFRLAPQPSASVRGAAHEGPANGISIEVDDRGPRDGEPLLLVMGLGMQLIGWPDELVDLLVDRGFRVIRIDNRDAGLSDGFDDRGVPNMASLMLRHALHLPMHVPYRLADMAADAVGVVDALGLDSVHVCGASMGGMISQHLRGAIIRSGSGAWC